MLEGGGGGEILDNLSFITLTLQAGSHYTEIRSLTGQTNAFFLK
jgi:hypothetical protein